MRPVAPPHDRVPEVPPEDLHTRILLERAKEGQNAAWGEIYRRYTRMLELRVRCDLPAASGDVHWKNRVGGDFFSSPVIIGDRLFCTDVRGTTVVLSASKNYELLAKNRLRDDMHASPAVAAGRLYLRTFHHLISLGGKK